MSPESKSSSNPQIEWRNSFKDIPGTDLAECIIKVGDYEFGNPEFYYGVLKFLGGEKAYELLDKKGINCLINIPQTVDGEVEIGKYKMPYKEYVGRVIWSMRTAKNIADPYEHTLSLIDSFGREALRAQLLENVPEENPLVQKAAEGLKQEMDKKEEKLRRSDNLFQRYP
jgi:hypothetical protein